MHIEGLEEAAHVGANQGVVNMTQAEAFHEACTLMRTNQISHNARAMIACAQCRIASNRFIVNNYEGSEWEFPDKSVVWVASTGLRTFLPKHYK